MPKHIMLVFGLLLHATSTGCAGQTHSSFPDKSRAFTVTCNSTVNYDTSACQVKANETCGRRARLAGIISSIEMTGRPTARLYTITARYECEGT